VILRDYQIQLANRCYEIIKQYRLVYLAAEVRVGKTLVALETAKLLGAKRVLFVTKKMVIPAILNDYSAGLYETDYQLKVVNYERLGKVAPFYDLIIVDEAHALGAFPKPSLRVKELKRIVGNNYYMLLSGTPTPESYSQLFHQLYPSSSSPFFEKSFFQWVDNGYARRRTKVIRGYNIYDYSDADQARIEAMTKHLFVTFTQKEANFEVPELKDEVEGIDIMPETHHIARELLTNRYYAFKDGAEVVCDSAVSLQQKLHQLYSGTIITSFGSKIIDDSKVRHILDNYVGKVKVAIFYLYTAEGSLLRSLIPETTSDPNEFNASEGKVFISQFQSGSRGINLSSADVIIFYNIHFSSELYQQSRMRGSERDKSVATRLVWLFSNDGIEHHIYPRVVNKLSYTASYFRRDYGIQLP
jgi:hypothetical protein